jgi:DNA-binding transcriptional regulator GbsR (MarR family)
MGTHWGINRTMAQVHALLMISPEPLTQDDVMAQLNISRGNVNMNVRDLIDWGLVDRVIISGERKEYFTAEKDIWKVATKIIKERKKRELDPLMKLMDQLSKVDGDKKDKDVKTFVETINGIKKFGAHADSMLDVLVKSDENWFVSTALKLFK